METRHVSNPTEHTLKICTSAPPTEQYLNPSNGEPLYYCLFPTCTHSKLSLFVSTDDIYQIGSEYATVIERTHTVPRAPNRTLKRTHFWGVYAKPRECVSGTTWSHCGGVQTSFTFSCQP